MTADADEEERSHPRKASLRSLLERVGLLPAAPEGNRYHAFISYSHAADGRLAPALQKGLQRFAKPWYRPRALHVFRDEAVLAANPHLWTSIRQALDHSEFFILLASPQAAASRWVGREAERWRQTKPSGHILVGLTDGELAWDETTQDYDWQRTDALPRELEGAFEEEPRHIDLRWARTADDLSLTHPRFREAVADLAAPLHGKPKEEIASEEVRQHRRTVWIARGAVATLLTLTSVAVVAGILFLDQRNTARAELRLAESRQLAAQAAADLLAGATPRGLLLALESYRSAHTVEARESLLQGVAATKRFTHHLLGHTESVTTGAYSADGKTLAAGSDDKTVILWSTRTGRRLGVLRVPLPRGLFAVRSVAFSPDGRTLATGNDDDTVILWDVRTGQPTRTLERVPPVRRGNTITYPGFANLAFSPDGRTLAGSSGGATFLWDLRTGRRREVLRGQRGSVDSVAFSPNGDTVASGSDDDTVVEWDAKTGHRRRVLRIKGGATLRPVPGIKSGVTSVTFNPRGSTLATASSNGGTDSKAILWDARSGQQIGQPMRAHIPGGQTGIVHIAFSPDGTTLASIGGGGLVFFDVATGRQLGDELRGPPVGVDLLETSILAVRPQGDDVATGNATDNSVIVWGPLPLNADIAAVRRHFCAIAGRNLTRAEWRLFVPGEPYHRTCTP